MITAWVIGLSLIVINFVVGILPTVTFPDFLNVSNYLNFDLSVVSYFFPFETAVTLVQVILAVLAIKYTVKIFQVIANRKIIP